MLYTVNVKMGYDDEMNIKDNDILFNLLHDIDLKSTYDILKKYDRKDFEIFKSLIDNEMFYICSTLEDKGLENQLVNFIQTDIDDMLNKNNVSYYLVKYHKTDMLDYI